MRSIFARIILTFVFLSFMQIIYSSGSYADFVTLEGRDLVKIDVDNYILKSNSEFIKYNFSGYESAKIVAPDGSYGELGLVDEIKFNGVGRFSIFLKRGGEVRELGINVFSGYISLVEEARESYSFKENQDFTLKFKVSNGDRVVILKSGREYLGFSFSNNELVINDRAGSEDLYKVSVFSDDKFIYPLNFEFKVLGIKEYFTYDFKSERISPITFSLSKGRYGSVAGRAREEVNNYLLKNRFKKFSGMVNYEIIDFSKVSLEDFLDTLGRSFSLAVNEKFYFMVLDSSEASAVKRCQGESFIFRSVSLGEIDSCARSFSKEYEVDLRDSDYVGFASVNFGGVISKSKVPLWLISYEYFNSVFTANNSYFYGGSRYLSSLVLNEDRERVLGELRSGFKVLNTPLVSKSKSIDLYRSYLASRYYKGFLANELLISLFGYDKFYEFKKDLSFKNEALKAKEVFGVEKSHLDKVIDLYISDNYKGKVKSFSYYSLMVKSKGR